MAGGRLWDHRDITRLSEPSPCTQRSDSTSSHIGCWEGPSRCARAHKALSACARAVWSASCERHRRAFHVQQCGLGRGEHAAGNALRTLLHPASAADSRGRCSLAISRAPLHLISPQFRAPLMKTRRWLDALHQGNLWEIQLIMVTMKK